MKAMEMKRIPILLAAIVLGSGQAIANPIFYEVMWPNTGSMVISNSTYAPSGLAPVNNNLVYATAGSFANLSTANNGVLVTSAGGVPSISTTLPAGLTIPGFNATITWPLSGNLMLAGGNTPTSYSGSSCAGGQAVNGLTAAGAVSGCFTPSGAGTINSGSSPAIAQYQGAGSTTVGPASVSGDATLASGGALTVTAIGGKAVTLGAALTTTGAGATTLAFPASPFTFTFPSASKTLLATDGSNAAAGFLAAAVPVATGCGGTTNFVRADGACAAPAGSGNVSTSGTITTATLGVWNGATTQTGTGTFAGNETMSGTINFTGTFQVGGAAMAFPATAKTLLATDGSNAAAGFLAAAVPVATGCGGTTNFVRADGTCQPTNTAVLYVGVIAGTNTYTIAAPTPSSPAFVFTNQYIVRASMSATNTTAATLNVNSTGAKPIVANTQSGFSPLVGGELVAGLQYDFTASTSAATACASGCYVVTNVAQSSIASGGQTVTAAQWAAGTVINITTAGQTIALPLSTTLSPNGGLFVNVVSNSVTLSVTNPDAVNGGSAGASFVIPANTLAMVTTPAANVINVTPGATGVTAGSCTLCTISVDSFGRVLTTTTGAPVSAANGGTGSATLTAHGLLVGEGTSAVASTGPVADSVPVWGSAASDPSTAGTSSTADSVLGWGAAGAAPAPEALTSCSTASSAVTYNTSTHAWGCNTISGGGITPNPAYVASNWYLPWSSAWTTMGNSNAMVVTTIYCSAGTVWNSVHVNSLSIHISTGGSSNVQLAIYNSGTNGLASTLVINTANIVNTGTGDVTGAVTSTSLPAGEYWFCNMTNDTTMVAFRTNADTTAMGAMTYGQAGTTPGFFGNSGNQIGVAYTGQTFGTWPGTLAAATNVQDSAHALVIAFKVNTVP